MSRPPWNGSDDPGIHQCPKMQAACQKANDKRAAEQAVADAATAAHRECATQYRNKLAAADERHRVRVIEANAARNSAVAAALRTYDEVDPIRGDAEASRAYSKAVADADKTYTRALAESARIAGSERDTAWQEYRASPGWLGEPAP